MASPRPPIAPGTRPGAPTPATDTGDWPAQAADAIERVVQDVRAKTTGPAINAARWVVAGVFLAIAGTMALVLLIVGLIRLIDAYLPDAWFGEDHIWAAYLVLGLPVMALGAVLVGRRHPPADR